MCYIRHEMKMSNGVQPPNEMKSHSPHEVKILTEVKRHETELSDKARTPL